MNSALPLFLGILLYLWQAYEYSKLGAWPMAGVFVGYSVSNAFFVLDVWRRVSP